MIRPALAVALAALACIAHAEPTVVGPPEIARGEAPRPTEACENTMRADNCSRVLACVGSDGLWFDGRATGWNEGTLQGRMSDGTACAGSWGRGGWLGFSTEAKLTCEDGRTVSVRYTAQDPESGTGLASGVTSDGAPVRAWTGRNVLAFLAGEDGVARLPCDAGAIPIS